MIELTQGDIIHADTEALVNTVNCVGIMGRGIALQFRKFDPNNFKQYKAACDRKELRPGKMLVHARNTLTNPRYIINFPTKVHWKGNSRIEYIEQGLSALIEEVRRLGVHSIALPPLGCGLGGLDWEEVRPRIEAAFALLPDVRVLLYEPAGAPAPQQMSRETKPPRMTLSRAVLLELIQHYLAALMDTHVTLLELHKLMYFMQEAGEDLKLRYSKGPLGPYAQNLRHALLAIDGYFVTGYGDGQDDPSLPIDLIDDALDLASKNIQEAPQTQRRLERVAELISGFETPFGMELLATVHWVAIHDGAADVENAIKSVYQWNKRKRMFEERQIRVAWTVLEQKGWISKIVKSS